MAGAFVVFLLCSQRRFNIIERLVSNFEISKTIHSIMGIKPLTEETIHQTLIWNEEQRILTELFKL